MCVYIYIYIYITYYVYMPSPTHLVDSVLDLPIRTFTKWKSARGRLAAKPAPCKRFQSCFIDLAYIAC